MRKFFDYSLGFIIALFLTLNLLAQGGSKWRKILEDSTKVVYLDTTSVRISETQAVCWTLEKFKKGIKIKSVPEKIFRQKEQIVFNIPRRHFNILGSLYYNKDRLVGDSYSQNLVGTGGIFSKPISMNKTIEKIYGFILENYIHPEDVSVAVVDSGSLVKSGTEVKKDSSVLIEKSDSSAAHKPESKEANNTSALAGNNSSKTVTIDSSNASLKTKPAAKSKTTVTATAPYAPPVYSGEPEYNQQNERNVTRTIFTDGNLFTVQVSSWRHKRYAERQVKKLKELGYNAFVVRAYIKKFHGYWNRVRVGYFKTLKEAKNIQRKLRRILK